MWQAELIEKYYTDEDTHINKTGIYYDDAKIDTEQLVKNFALIICAYTIIRPSAVIGVGSVWINEPLQKNEVIIRVRIN